MARVVKALVGMVDLVAPSGRRPFACAALARPVLACGWLAPLVCGLTLSTEVQTQKQKRR
jgi:hypothetical protein